MFWHTHQTQPLARPALAPRRLIYLQKYGIMSREGDKTLSERFCFSFNYPEAIYDTRQPTQRIGGILALTRRLL